MTLAAVRDFATELDGLKYGTILADPPWRFENRTGKMAPEHRRLSRYETMTLHDICPLPGEGIAHETAHLYLWAPNALLPAALRVMNAWGCKCKSNVLCHKVRNEGRH